MPLPRGKETPHPDMLKTDSKKNSNFGKRFCFSISLDCCASVQDTTGGQHVLTWLDFRDMRTDLIRMRTDLIR